MTLVLLLLVLNLTFCTCARTQSARTILKDNLGSDVVKLVQEMSSEIKKLKEEHAELRRIVQECVGNQKEMKREIFQRREQRRLKREENDHAMTSDVRDKFLDRVEELDRFKADLKLLHRAQKDWSPLKEQIRSIQHEQRMMRIVQKKMLITQKELKRRVSKRRSTNVQIKGHSKNGVIPIYEKSVSKRDPTDQRSDKNEKEHDQKDEAEMELGYDYKNENKGRLGKEANIHTNESKIEQRHSRKNNIKHKKEPMNGKVQSKRTSGEHYAFADGNKGKIRKSVSIYTAFSARFSDDLRHFVIGQPIVFGDVYLNLGNGYDRNSGIFRAPVAGLYLVLMTISSAGYHTPDVEVVKNGSPFCRVVVYTFNTATVGSPCNVLVELSVGDEVWARDLLHTEGVGIRGQYYSTFSMTLVVSDQASGSSS
ncbi:hypothetical protein ACJMK2_011302 [Sinanodonta woodiana]|uniref:C1q domain-containing protein n=1 Tax=Sinanodonta woodiana TaxID=1069815 RepID=A0ABD3V7S3_SINWO